MKIRATVAYDGTGFFGFQRQARHRSVQGEIENAIERVCEERVTLSGAGRTDTGVHATGQVIAFSTGRWRHSLDALQRAINVNLPEDVAVRDLAECPEQFHPRFSAASRVYEYTIEVSAVRRPLTRRYAWQIGWMPDLRRLSDAAERLVGEHDFAAFGSAPHGEGTVRRVLRAEWIGSGDRLTFVIEANAFLFRMVRRIVATLMRAGRGQIDADEVSRTLAGRDPDRAKGAAPACGLCLVEVKY